MEVRIFPFHPAPRWIHCNILSYGLQNKYMYSENAVQRSRSPRCYHLYPTQWLKRPLRKPNILTPKLKTQPLTLSCSVYFRFWCESPSVCLCLTFFFFSPLFRWGVWYCRDIITICRYWHLAIINPPLNGLFQTTSGACISPVHPAGIYTGTARHCLTSSTTSFDMWALNVSHTSILCLWANLKRVLLSCKMITVYTAHKPSLFTSQLHCSKNRISW